MKIIWDVWGYLSGEFVIGLLAIIICTFLHRVWRFVNRKPVSKESMWDVAYPLLIVNVWFCAGLVVLMIGTFIYTTWQHINEKPCNITVISDRMIVEDRRQEAK